MSLSVTWVEVKEDRNKEESRITTADGWMDGWMDGWVGGWMD
jgi:hypothetical protein